MGTVFLHQIRDNVRSLRFQVSLVVLLLFFAGNGAVYTLKTQRLFAETARIEADGETRYAEVENLRQAAGNWYKILSPATGTEFIAEAGFNWFEHHIWLTPRTGNNTWTGSTRSQNNWMRHFEVVDWTVVVRYVVSFLCIVLAYNAISGELESGTLRLALSGPLSRGAFLVAKFLAHLCTLLAAVLVGSLISLLILALNGVLELNWTLWRAFLFFLLCTALFIALFLLLGMGVSISARSSASSLVLLITAWTVLVVIIPQSSYMIAVRLVEGPGAYWEKINQHERQVRQSLERQGLQPRPPELARADHYAVEKRYVERLGEMEREEVHLVTQARRQMVRQYRTAMRINLISPSFAFQYAVEGLLGAGIAHFESFVEQGRRYRRDLREFLRARDAGDPDSAHILFLPQFMSARTLESDLIPRFKEDPLPLAARLEEATAPLLILALEAAIAFFFALWAFNRADLVG